MIAELGRTTAMNLLIDEPRFKTKDDVLEALVEAGELFEIVQLGFVAAEYEEQGSS